MGNEISSIVSGCFEPAKKLVFEKANEYIFKLEDHLDDLERVERRLKTAEDDARERLDSAARNRLRRDGNVEVWISEVEAIQPKVRKLLEDRTAEVERLSMCGICSTNCFLTYKYGKDVFETLEKAQTLLSSKPSGEVGRKGLPPGIVEIATKSTVGLEKMLEATWNRLMEKRVGILGIYGMGGVGKTTLVKQINQKLLEEKLKDEFEIVIFVVVSQNLQVEKIQNEIGERLGISEGEWKTKTQEKKASHIYDVLSKRRFVMLLDDIWEKVNLEEIGIPLPSPVNGSKVVFTTRSKYVCGRMGPDNLEVKLLDPENAWELFLQKVRGAGIENDPKILELAKEVCKKCEGLPLALNVIGETMSCKTSVHEWEYAIDVLNTNAANYGEVKDEIIKVLKLSYDNLGDEEAKACFEYCALFPEDEEIDNRALVEHWISEGIINEGGDRKRGINKGYDIIGILVRACLLMPVDTLEKVTMHDVIRQMALWVASKCGKEKENFVVKAAGAGLKEMPEVENWKEVTRMSLVKNDISDISISPECPNLTTLFLTKNKLVNISGGFFLSMPKLVTLNLSFNKKLAKLPEEVSNLVSLRHLDVSYTSLENLPEGLGKLIELRYLALTGVGTLQSISVISSLGNIQVLLLRGATHASLEWIKDIELLKNLKVLGVSIGDVVVLKHLLSIPRLASCIEHIDLRGLVTEEEGEGPFQFETAAASLRSIYFWRRACFISDIILEHTRYGSFQNLSVVKFYFHRRTQDLSWLVFAPNLTFVEVTGNLRMSGELQEIVSRDKVSGKLDKGIVPFRKLHTLRLILLGGLTSIYRERLEFPSLKTVLIMNCPKLRKLPISKERAYYFGLHVKSPEWFERLEWEDEEATEY